MFRRNSIETSMFVSAAALASLAFGLAMNTAAAAEATTPAIVGNAEAGQTAYKKCATCHSVAPGQNRLGPSLYGVVGRKAGGLDGFNYSEAMQQSNVIWTADTLNSHLADIKGFIPGNRMAQLYPAGVPNAADRANIIAYLMTLTDE